MDTDRLAYTYDNSIDWTYKNIPQEYGGNVQVLRAGQALGGTSVMNGAAYARAESVQIDTWGIIGNEGWAWDNLFPYYLKSENMSAPNQTQVEAGASIDSTYHSTEGPLHVGFLNIQKQENDLTTALNRTLATMGVPSNPDLNTGHMRGFTIHPSAVDVSTGFRGDAARAYYWPYADRKNLHVMLDTFVTYVAWEHRCTGEDIIAAGVEIKTQNGEEQLIRAKKEVILAAGALRSPTILELSGVGNPRVLKQRGIPVQINLPSVGENLQDQLNTSIVVSTKSPVTETRTVAFASASDIFGLSLDSVSASTHSQLPYYANTTAAMSNGAMKASDLQKLFEIQHDQIFNKKVSIAEFVFIFRMNAVYSYRILGSSSLRSGNSHITSADPDAAPVVNPNYGMLEWDTQIQIAMSRFLRKMYRTGEMGDLIADETLLGLGTVPENASDEIWKKWVGEQYTPNCHVIGTASMLPRSMGGVVDNRLKVYGATNVRVVNASIQPMQVSGNPMDNLYAIAEWVSDMIKEDADTGN